MSTGKGRTNCLQASVVSIGPGGKGCIVIKGLRLSLPQKNRRVVDNASGFWRQLQEGEQFPPLKLRDKIYFNLKGRTVTSWISMNGYSDRKSRKTGLFRSKIRRNG